jgi:hypothetical protein
VIAGYAVGHKHGRWIDTLQRRRAISLSR